MPFSCALFPSLSSSLFFSFSLAEKLFCFISWRLVNIQPQEEEEEEEEEDIKYLVESEDTNNSQLRGSSS